MIAIFRARHDGITSQVQIVQIFDITTAFLYCSHVSSLSFFVGEVLIFSFLQGWNGHDTLKVVINELSNVDSSRPMKVLEIVFFK